MKYLLVVACVLSACAYGSGLVLDDHDGAHDHDDELAFALALEEDETCDDHAHDQDHDHAHEGESAACADDHDHAHGDDVVELTPAQEREAGLRTAPAGPARLASYVELYGAITVNDDRYAHILSRVPGTVIDVRARLGDAVTAGMVLAVVDSTELADAKAEYLAAVEQLALEESIFAQEEEVWKKNVSSQRDYLNARRNLAHARIAARSARQKVLSFGFCEEYLRRLPDEPEHALTRFNITAPFDGTVIEKHVTRGEVLKPDSETALFSIADLATVWCALRVPQQHLASITQGQPAVIDVGGGLPQVRAPVEYVGPVVREESRTALARVVVTNTAGIYRPGLFVTARVETDTAGAAVCVPRDAVQMVDGSPAVFVRGPHGYLIRPVTLGRQDHAHIEIRSGLAAGEQVVTHGAFTLKAHLVTSGMDAHAGHGH